MPNIGLTELLILAVLVGLIALVARVLSRPRRQSRALRPPAPEPGWYRDPTRRHERRFWQGSRWSAAVSDGGVHTEDPM